MNGSDTLKNVAEYIRRKYGIKPDYPFEDDTPVFRHTDNGKWFAIVIRDVPNAKLCGGEGRSDVINFKCDPLLASCAADGTLTVTGFDCSKTGSEAVDLMTASRTGMSGDNPQQVVMQFGHELARVNVVATVEGGDATVTNITFAGMATSGDYSSTGGWSNTATGSFTNSTDQTLNTEGVDLLGDMLLIPQDVSGFTVTVDYTVGGVAQPQKVITLPTTISQWDKGKSYKYTLSFKRNTLTVIVKVVDWKEEDTSVSWG